MNVDMPDIIRLSFAVTSRNGLRVIASNRLGHEKRSPVQPLPAG